MAKPPASKQCFACGATFTKVMFSHPVGGPAQVCNGCMLSTNGKLPPTPFDPKHVPSSPVPDELADVELPQDNVGLLETAERVLIRRSLLALVNRFHPDYNAGWVHEDICRRLERFVRDVEARLSPRLLLCMPPRHGKSTLTSNFLPAWALGLHPEWEIIAASHTQSLALKFSGFIRDLLRDPSYTAIFPGTVLSPESQSKEAWDTTRRGGYLAAGVGTGITGRGAHIALIDDPVKDMESADSMTMRDSIWEWYTSTMYTRLAPGGGVLGILTLWNEDDWGGRIIEVSESGQGDKFEIVRYPAINEGYAEYLDENQRDIIHVIAPAAPPPGATLLRLPGTALHPARYDLKALAAIKKNYYARGNQRTWSALYQQRPTPEDGIFFTKGMFRYYSSAPARRFCTVYQAWDFAITEDQKNDYTSCTTLLQDTNDSLYVIDVCRFRSNDSIEIVDKMLDQYELFGADLVGVEDGQIWKTMQAQWDKRCQERKLYPAYEILKPLTDKNVRAMPLRGRMQLGKVYFPLIAPWKDDFEKELLTFPGGKHDDMVDSTSWAVRLTLSKAAPRLPEPMKLQGWRDKLKITSLADAGHMAA